jgi:hypothetical protein
MTNTQSDLPKSGETITAYAKRLDAKGQRELFIRKALRTHFDLSIDETITACNALSNARNLELQSLRKRFPDLNENRFAWKISKTLTIPKEDALIWAQTIIAGEDKG